MPARNSPSQSTARKREDYDYFGDDAAEAAFAAAKQELREFWRSGNRSLTKHETYARGPSAGKKLKPKVAEARKLGWNPEKLRQARLFATRCTEKELERRISEASNAIYPPYWTILVSVYQVTNKRQRESMWKECRTEKLSRHDLDARIRASGLSREIRVPSAGRTLTPPRSVEEAQHRLRQAAEQFLRVQQSCRGTLHPDGLPTAARRALERSKKVLTDLATALSAETE
jgi:hypothetical protein